MKKPWKGLNNSGDTIVEVLIVLAILSLSFAISYATARSGLNKSRNAQEHSVALGILSSQAELARSAYASGTDLTTVGSFCLPYPSSPGTWKPANDTACKNFNGSGLYEVSNDYNAAGGYFSFHVQWAGLGSLGTQKEDINYKLLPLLPPGADSFQDETLSYQAPNLTQPFSATKLGGEYATCVPAEPAWNDGSDGCFRLNTFQGPLEYSRRNVSISYTFPPDLIKAGTAKLVINYNQYSGANTVPPAGYGAYQLRIASGTGQTWAVSLPIESNSQSWSARLSPVFNIEVPNDPTLTLTWTNNGTNLDPDLQIDSFRLWRD